MRTTLRQRLWIAALVAVGCVASRRLTLVADQPSQKSAAVRIVAAGQTIAGTPGKKGATYYALEGQTTRLTTTFVDGTKAVAERGVDGNLATRLEDIHGNEINRVKIDRMDGVNDILQYSPFGGAPVLAQLEPTVRQTLDWSNQQSHRLYQDRVLSGTRLEWNEGMMRKAGAPPADDDRDNDRDVGAVETLWANGLTARTVRRAATPGTTFDGKQVRGDILSTRLMRDGVEVGNASYLTYERIFTWVMPGISEGLIATEQLKARYGGWPFTPDLVWMNLQTLGTFHWRTLLRAKGTVARLPSTRGTNPLLQFFLPSLAANEPGCDDLHWLDGSVFRPCCDMHDACYYAATPSCTQRSWWYWGSWSCDRCNIMAFGCFLGGGIHPPYVQYP